MGKKVVAIIKLAYLQESDTCTTSWSCFRSTWLKYCSFWEYNAKTADKGDLIIPVEISVFEDRSYKFILKTPPASVLLAKAAKLKKGSDQPNKNKVGSVTVADLEEIAKMKLPDLNTNNIASATRIIEGTAKSMGLTIKE